MQRKSIVLELIYVLLAILFLSSLIKLLFSLVGSKNAEFQYPKNEDNNMLNVGRSEQINSPEIAQKSSKAGIKSDPPSSGKSKKYDLQGKIIK